MLNKFDEFENDRQEQKKGDWRTKRCAEQADWQGKYTRWNYLLSHGITKGNQESTDAQALQNFKKKIDIELTQKDLDRTHRIGKNDKSSNRPRPKFTLSF